MDRKEAFNYIMNGKGSMESFYKIHHCIDDDNWKEGQETIIKETGCDENTAKWVWVDIKNKLCPNKYEQSQSQPTPSHIPTCPTCGSTNIQKISGISRAAHGYMFGLFSKTAKSQFCCKNCGFKW